MHRTLPAIMFLVVLGAKLAVAAEQRIALVIGNSAYVDSPLINPVNDARLIGAALRARGLELVGPSQYPLEHSIISLGDGRWILTVSDHHMAVPRTVETRKHDVDMLLCLDNLPQKEQRQANHTLAYH